MTRVVALAMVLLALALVPAAPARAADGARVVVVGVPGLHWDDVAAGRAPAVAALVADGAVGALSVKAAGPLTCAADGWLTLGAGNRVSVDDDARPCAGDVPSTAVLDAVAARAARTREGADVGALAKALGRAGACVTTDGPGAVLAVGATADAAPSGCAVRLVDGGSVQEADAVIAREAAARAPGTTLLVVGVSEAPGADGPQLHVAVATGPGHPAGALVSASTRRAPYVQLVDVAPTVLSLLGVVAPPEMTGEPWRSVGDAPTVADLRDVARKAAAAREVTVAFFVALVAALLAALCVAAARRSWRLAEVAGLACTAALGASYVANLVPWWRADPPLAAVLAVVGVVTAAVVAAALLLSPIFASLRETRRTAPQGDEDRRGGGGLAAAGGVCAFVAAVLIGDLLTGSRLQMSSVAGYSPLVAGRFAGIGNVAFGVLAASVLLAAAAATHATSRRTTLAVLTLVGALTVVVDGAPPFGSDVGGVLALVPAFAVLAMLRTGARVSLPRLVLAGLAGAAVVTAFALADFSRSEQDRTHLGRFVQDVLDGTAGTLLARKGEAVVALLFRSPVTALLPLVVAAAVYLVVRPPDQLRAAFEAAPAWRHGLVAVGVASAVGFTVNDSGAAVPALAVLVAAPATIAVVARVSRLRQGTGG